MADLAADTTDTASKAKAADKDDSPATDGQNPGKDPAPATDIASTHQVDPATDPAAQVVPPASTTEPDQSTSDTGAKNPPANIPTKPTTATLVTGDVPPPAATGKPDSKLPPSNLPQKLEIQLQNPIEPKTDLFEAKVVIPWVLALIGWAVAIALYRLTRKNKINDDLNDIVIEDIKAFLEKIEELTRLVASHQGGCPCQGGDLRNSREHLTALRQTAVAISNRVDRALLNTDDSDEWKKSYREWKSATEGNTDWITNRNKKWNRENMTLLEQANEEYTGKIINFRNRVVTRKIKLKS
jgi:hypothetical protein